MTSGNASQSGAWRGALEDAAGRLGESDASGLIFQEEREDLRVVATLNQVVEAVHTRLAGLSVARPGCLGEILVSDPDPGDAAAIVRNDPVPSRLPRNAPAPSCLDPVPARERLESLLCSVRRAWGDAPLDARARWVASIQRIRVVGPAVPFREEVRRGARLRLEVRGPRNGFAVVEKALRPGDALDERRLAFEAVHRARERAGAVEARPGEATAVFAAGVGGVLVHELVGHSLEADTVESGASLLASTGGRVAPQGVTVVDDPRLGRVPWLWDDEGEESRPVLLLSEGRVIGSLHDRGTAGRAGEMPNGHGRRSSFQQRTHPRMGCTFLSAGAMASAEIFEGIEHGIHIRRLEAASTDPARGRATLRVIDADRVEGGRIAAPLLPFLIFVSTLDTLSTLDRVASDLAFDTCIGSCMRDAQPLATSVGAPTFRAGLIRVVP